VIDAGIKKGPAEGKQAKRARGDDGAASFPDDAGSLAVAFSDALI